MWCRRRYSCTLVSIQDMDTVFDRYSGPDGKIDYKHFIEELLFREDEIESNSSKIKTSQKSVAKDNNDNKSQSRVSHLQESKNKLAESNIK